MIMISFIHIWNIHYMYKSDSACDDENYGLFEEYKM